MAGVGEGTFKRGNESELTYRLKWAAWQWLYVEAGCRSIGLEVKLEGPAGRIIDVVGVAPGSAIYVVEVKASKSDASRDDRGPQDRARLAARGPVVEQRRALAQEIASRAEEHARDEAPESWEDLEGYRLAAADYARVSREAARYEERLDRFSIKFRDPKFMALADYHYIMAPRGLVRRHQLPPQWGLLDEGPSVVVAAPHKEVRKTSGIMSNVLRAIARANTTSMMRHHGVSFGVSLYEGAPLFPDLSEPGDRA